MARRASDFVATLPRWHPSPAPTLASLGFWLWEASGGGPFATLASYGAVWKAAVKLAS